MKNKFKQPIDLIVDEDQPNTCPFDGTRTDELQQDDDYTIEMCPECLTLFNFWNDEDIRP